LKCFVCKEEFKNNGKMFVKNTGEIFFFCSSKCHKNFKLGRDPKKLKWAK